MSKQDPMMQLARELDRESYEWLAENHPAIAEAMELERERQLRRFPRRN